MPTVDFATAQIFIDDNLIDVSFEFAHSELKDILKEKYKPIFIKDRRCWRIDRRKANVDVEEVIATVEKTLYDTAPPGWRKIVDTFKDFCCATKRYEIKFGPGGLRLIFPGGHAGHYRLRKITGRETRLDTWLLPAKTIKAAEIMPLVKRAEEEDRRLVEDAMEDYENRTLRGRLVITPDEADESNVIAGKVCFADFAFVSKVEPHVADAQLQYWPFKVLERNDRPAPTEENPNHVEIDVRFVYLPPAAACKAIRKYMSLDIEDRPWPLDVTRASEKWKAKVID